MAVSGTLVTVLVLPLAIGAGAALAVASPDPAARPAAAVDRPRPAPAAPGPALLLPVPPAPPPPPGTSPPGTSPSGSARPAGSGYRWPLSPVPRVVHPFAPGPLRWSAGHRGADLAGATGQAVLAAAGGRVLYAGVLAGRPVVAVLHPDGIRTTYEPVDPAVTAGDHVSAGQLLGRLVPAGAHCAPTCLHWGALRGATYLDPLALLPHAPAVLLPLGPLALSGWAGQ